MLRSTRPLVTLALAIAASAAVFAAPVTIRLATVAPINSTWHKALLDMGELWKKSTEGRVLQTVFASQADEATIIRKMRPGVDQFQAGFIMAAGLAQIDEAFNVLGIPFFFQSDAEELEVQQKLTPVLEKRLEAKGFHLLSWGNGGWVQLFSKTPLRSLDEVKKAKLYTSQGEPKMVQWYQSNGFNPQPLAAGDLVTQLKLPNGAINAAPSPPYGALVLQLFRDAKYMLDLRVGPLIGAVIMSNDAWNKIAPEDRQKVVDGARAFESRLSTDAPKLDADSLATMTQRGGLTVIKLDPKATSEFQAAAEKLTATMRGSMVPEDIYKLAFEARDAYRESKGR